MLLNAILIALGCTIITVNVVSFIRHMYLYILKKIIESNINKYMQNICIPDSISDDAKNRDINYIEFIKISDNDPIARLTKIADKKVEKFIKSKASVSIIQVIDSDPLFSSIYGNNGVYRFKLYFITQYYTAEIILSFSIIENGRIEVVSKRLINTHELFCETAKYVENINYDEEEQEEENTDESVQ